MYQLTKLILGALLACSVLISYAFAVGSACGPNSRPCQSHHEHCTCKGK